MKRHWPLICLGIGTVAAAAGLILAPRVTWAALLANFLFWTGLAQGGVVLAAILHLAEARWGRVVERIAAGLGAFLPLSLLLFLLLWFGRGTLFLWDGLALAVVTALCLTFLYRLLRPVAGPPRPLAGALVVAFGLEYALLSIDLGASLDPRFRSTILPVIYLAGALYSALGVTAVVLAAWRPADRLREVITPSHRLDLGNLIWAFSILLAYLWWSQYIVIWMGNLPNEVAHHAARWQTWPWSALAWATLTAACLLPLLLLFSRSLKQHALALAWIGGIGAFGVLLQRFLDVFPALGVMAGIGAALLAVGVSLGFLGAATLSYLWLMRRVPLFPEEDPRFREALALRDVRL